MTDHQINTGTFMPVKPDAMVEVLLTNGNKDTGKAKCFYWSNSDMKRISNVAGFFLHRVRSYKVLGGMQ